MRINLIVPFFAPDIEMESQRAETFRKWCDNEFEPKIKR